MAPIRNHWTVCQFALPTPNQRWQGRSGRPVRGRCPTPVDAKNRRRPGRHAERNEGCEEATKEQISQMRKEEILVALVHVQQIDLADVLCKVYFKRRQRHVTLG